TVSVLVFLMCPTRRSSDLAARWRCARLGHQRQGGIQVQPDALGVHAHGEGNVQRSAGLEVSVPGSVTSSGIHPELDTSTQDPERSEEHTSELQSRENIVCR